MAIASSHEVPRRVREVAADHYRVDAGIQVIYWFPYADDDPGTSPLRLLEVDNGYFSSDTVDPIHLHGSGAYPDIRIALLRPEDWLRVDRGELPLPEGWDRPVPVTREMVADR